jgi:hypothetical protein
MRIEEDCVMEVLRWSKQVREMMKMHLYQQQVIAGFYR